MSRISQVIEQYGVLQSPLYFIRLFQSRCFSFVAARSLAKCGRKFNAHYSSRIIGVKDIAIGDDFFSGPGLWLEAVRYHKTGSFTPNIQIGSGVAMNANVHVACVNRVSIGDHTLFASNIFITDHNHGRYQGGGLESDPRIPPNEREVNSPGEVRIGSNCWIGENVAILPGSSIGDGCVIGANAVVNGEIPANSIAVGAPARVVKEFDPFQNKWISVNSRRSIQ